MPMDIVLQINIAKDNQITEIIQSKYRILKYNIDFMIEEAI